MRFLPVTVLLASVCAAQPEAPRRLADAPKLVLAPHFVGVGIVSVCGADWFLAGGDWACARPGPNGLELVSGGEFDQIGPVMPSAGYELARGPLPSDHRYYVAGNFFFSYPVHEVDPVYLTRRTVSQLPAVLRAPVVHADVEGDGHPELVVGDGANRLLVTLPGGPYSPFSTLASTGVVHLAGQFDADPQSELGWLENYRLRFRDAATLANESWAPPGFYSLDRPAWTGDWDGDGRDELALPMVEKGLLGLIDLDTPANPIALAPGPVDLYRALGLIDWSAPGSRELVVLGERNMAVVDPRTGVVLHSQAMASGNFGQITALALDWDSDGDQDMLWLNGSLHLLRNPEGGETLQRSERATYTLGYASAALDASLVTISEVADGLILRLLDPQSLSARGESEITGTGIPATGVPGLPRYSLGDFHPGYGPELLRISPTMLHAHSLDGALLWQRPLAAGAYTSAELPSICLRECAPLIVAEYLPTGSTLRAIDGSTGNSRWTIAAGGWYQVHSVVDVVGDASPEALVVADSGDVRELWALNARDGTLTWRALLAGTTPVQDIRRGQDAVGVLYSDTTLALYSRDGRALQSRQLQADGRCERTCALNFRSRGATDGVWIVAGDDSDFLAVAQDLKGDLTEVQLAGPDFDHLRVSPSGLLHGIRRQKVTVWELDSDWVFNSGFDR